MNELSVPLDWLADNCIEWKYTNRDGKQTTVLTYDREVYTKEGDPLRVDFAVYGTGWYANARPDGLSTRTKSGGFQFRPSVSNGFVRLNGTVRDAHISLEQSVPSDSRDLPFVPVVWAQIHSHWLTQQLETELQEFVAAMRLEESGREEE